MKLLIITQKIDRNDPILGFFHGWVAEFAKQFKSIVVICLLRKNFSLPDNVAVLSLGKEKWRSKAKYIFLLFYFSLRYYNRYDAVFVHMNEEYIVIAGWLWRLMGKKVFMWRNHHAGNIMTDIASFFCNKVFCTSKFSYTAKYKKTTLMPLGIDMNIFKQNLSIKKIPKSILFLSRISPTKNTHIFIEALGILKKQEIEFSADIFGDALPKDEKYFMELKKRSQELSLEDKLKFYSGIANYETPKVYSAHEIFINLSSSGMYDKTILEAMTCGCLTLASNENLRGLIDERMIIKNREAEEVNQKLLLTLSLSNNEKSKIISDNLKFAESQSLILLSNKLAQFISE